MVDWLDLSLVQMKPFILAIYVLAINDAHVKKIWERKRNFQIRSVRRLICDEDLPECCFMCGKECVASFTFATRGVIGVDRVTRPIGIDRSATAKIDDDTAFCAARRRPVFTLQRYLSEE